MTLIYPNTIRGGDKEELGGSFAGTRMKIKEKSLLVRFLIGFSSTVLAATAEKRPPQLERRTTRLSTWLVMC